MALSGIQAQLSTMQQQAEKQDKQLSELHDSIKSLQEQAKTMQNALPKSKSRKSPHGLSVRCCSDLCCHNMLL